MDERAWLAERFEQKRGHLRAVAYRILGSHSDADDAVQEAWLRLSRSGTCDVENLGGWLTTVVARISLDVLRSRRSRREESLGAHVPEPITSGTPGTDPEHEALLADSVGLALLAVLETLAPAERVAFVLHDMFDLPFDEIAPIVGRSAVAARRSRSTHLLRTEVRNGGEPNMGERRRETRVQVLPADRRRSEAIGGRRVEVETTGWRDRPGGCPSVELI